MTISNSGNLIYYDVFYVMRKYQPCNEYSGNLKACNFYFKTNS